MKWGVKMSEEVLDTDVASQMEDLMQQQVMEATDGIRELTRSENLS